MKRRIAAILLAFGMIFGLSQTPAMAGNGTNNYYLTGSCSAGSGGWFKVTVTNWDDYLNQRYHISITPSGHDPYATYIDNVYLGRSREYIQWSGGHGRRTIKASASAAFGQRVQCSIYI